MRESIDNTMFTHVSDCYNVSDMFLFLYLFLTTIKRKKFVEKLFL